MEPKDKVDGCTMVLGGLKSVGNKEAAETWVNDKLWSLYGPKPILTYSKGDFHGLLFVQFCCVEDRNAAIQLLKNSGCQEGGNKVWAKREQPLEVRTNSSLVFGTKRLLDASIWADPDTGVVSVGKGGEVILTGTVSNSKLVIQYGSGWETYLHDPEYPEFKEMVATLQTKLNGGGTKITRKFAGKFTGKFAGKAADTEAGN